MRFILDTDGNSSRSTDGRSSNWEQFFLGTLMVQIWQVFKTQMVKFSRNMGGLFKSTVPGSRWGIMGNNSENNLLIDPDGITENKIWTLRCRDKLGRPQFIMGWGRGLGMSPRV